MAMEESKRAFERESTYHGKNVQSLMDDLVILALQVTFDHISVLDFETFVQVAVLIVRRFVNDC